MRKENLILFFLVALLQCYIGNAIKCYSCSGSCIEPSTIECGADQQCMTVEQRVDGKVQRQQKGCATSQQCNSPSSDSSLVQYCCNSDLCNGGNISNSTAGTSGTSSSSSLQCNSCDFYACPFKINTVTCNRGELCVTKTAKIGVPVIKLGCANATICSMDTTENIASTRVSVSNKCCNQDNCNFAVNVKLSSIAAIGAVLLLWITKLS
ncbi:uncharacterized protein [Aquarana catesbeiana]|uniref:uncharacterized protein n=1 Tax=Aquarana catesbeiana TaxID=8400 RepID=UPI003CC9C0D6